MARLQQCMDGRGWRRQTPGGGGGSVAELACGNNSSDSRHAERTPGRQPSAVSSQAVRQPHIMTQHTECKPKCHSVHASAKARNTCLRKLLKAQCKQPQYMQRTSG